MKGNLLALLLAVGAIAALAFRAQPLTPQYWEYYPGFKRLSYEVAFSEYAMALGYETAREDPNIPPDDLLYLGASLNRVSVAAAWLYR